MMHWIRKQFEGKTINYQYDIIATTPLVHDAEVLWNLFRNARTRYQKSCIMAHLTRHNRMLQFEPYRSLYDVLYDELH